MAQAPIRYTATILPEEATNKTIVWSVINLTGEATIENDENDGLLTPVAAGTIKVVATADDGSDVYAEKEVTIILPQEDIPVESITIEGPATIVLEDEE